MKLRMKKLLCMLLTGTMFASALIGCGAEEAAETVESAEVAEETEEVVDKTIVVGVESSTGREEGWKALAEAYMDKHPDVTVVVDLKPSEGYEQWVNSIVENSETTEADIVNINYISKKAEVGIDFNEYLHMDSPYSDGTFAEQFQQDIQQTSPGGGEMYEITLESTQVMWFYNQEIFEEVGVEVPTTWTELIDVCEKVEAAGYQAIAMPGDYDSFFSGTMGWLSQIYADQTTRSMMEIVRSQEGDYTYDPDIDADWVYDPTDPWNDDSSDVTRNPLRFYAGIKDGTITANTPGMKTVWTEFAKVFPGYAGGEAMFGTNGDGATSLFYQGKAAMMVNGGWGIVEFINNMAKVSAGEDVVDGSGAAIEDITVFTLGTFAMPTMEGEGIEAPARTIEVGGVPIGVIAKDQAHNDLVMDFMMYYTSAEGTGVWLDAALAADYAPSGPSLVYDAVYPEEVESAFANVEYRGNAQKLFGNAMARGLADLPESTREYYDNSYDYLTGKITVEQYLEKQEQNHLSYLEIVLQNSNIKMEDLDNPSAEPTGN